MKCIEKGGGVLRIKLDVKQLICEKLIDLMEEKPFLEIKVGDLCRYANIGRSTFYTHFDSIYAVVQHIVDTFSSGLPSENSEHQKQILLGTKAGKTDEERQWLEHWEKNKRILKILLGRNGDPSFQMRISNRISRTIKNNFSNSTRFSESEMQFIISYFSGGEISLLQKWACTDTDMSIDEIIALLERITLHLFKLLR